MPDFPASSRPGARRISASSRRGSTLLNRNVWIGRKRTSLRLERPMWQALEEVARNSELTIHAVCTLIDERRCQSSLTAAVRVFLLSYYRDAVLEAGQALGKSLLYRALCDDRT
jgi:predicted DNA-binding ribbon-helix-helix protein